MTRFLPSALVSAALVAIATLQPADAAQACSGLPKAGTLLASEPLADGLTAHSAAAVVIRNELGVEAAVILRNKTDSSRQVLRLASTSAASMVLAGASYGLEIAVGDRWCDADRGFLEGKSFRIVGGMKALAGAGVAVAVKRHAADPAKINVVFEPLAVDPQEMQRAIAAMQTGWRAVPRQDSSDTPPKLQGPATLPQAGQWLTESTERVRGVFVDHIQNGAHISTWLRDAMVLGVLPMLLLFFFGIWSLVGWARRRPRSKPELWIAPSVSGGTALAPGYEDGESPIRPSQSKQTQMGEAFTNFQRKRLLSMCMGDAGKAQRLINFEHRRDSRLCDEDAARRAIERWERDMSS